MGYCSLLLVIPGYSWLLLAVAGCCLLLLGIVGYWLLVFLGCHPLLLAALAVTIANHANKLNRTCDAMIVPTEKLQHCKYRFHPITHMLTFGDYIAIIYRYKSE